MNSVVGAAPRRALVGIVAVLLSSCSISPSATATSWPAPRRALTPDEKMEMAVSESGLVGVGMLAGVRDSLDDEGVLHRWMTFNPQRWLKGDGGTQVVRVHFPSISNFGWRQAKQWVADAPVRCLIFAREVKAHGSLVLVLAEHPEFPGMGIVRLSGPQADGEANAEATVKNLKPENLVLRSGLVVVGEVEPCVPRRAGCTQVRVDSVLVGALPSGALRAFYGAWGAYTDSGKTVFMLRAVDGANWEIVGFSSGALRIEGDRLAGTQETLPGFSARIRAASQSRESRGARP